MILQTGWKKATPISSNSFMLAEVDRTRVEKLLVKLK